MARKTHAQIGRDAVRGMAVQLMEYYNKSLAKMSDGTGKPADLKYVVDAGIRIMGFLEPQTDKAPADQKEIADPDKLAQAFGKLLANQDNQPTDSTE